MAKPILVVRVYQVDRKRANEITKTVEKIVGYEYHVLTVSTMGNDLPPSFECFNDCKGLPDVDIEKLINDLKNG